MAVAAVGFGGHRHHHIQMSQSCTALRVHGRNSHQRVGIGGQEVIGGRDGDAFGGKHFLCKAVFHGLGPPDLGVVHRHVQAGQAFPLGKIDTEQRIGMGPEIGLVDAVAVHGAAGIGDVFIKQVNGIGIGKIRPTGNVA
jgi:hypothetical protein